MQAILAILPYVQAVLALLVIGGVLLQSADASVGAFSDSSNATGHTRRGPEKTIFIGTIVLSILFVASAFIHLLV